MTDRISELREAAKAQGSISENPQTIELVKFSAFAAADKAEAALRAEMDAEREAHALLQARCFDRGPTFSSVFDEVQELRAHVEGLEKDAARYRWLRDESWKDPYAPGPVYQSLYDGIGGRAHSEDLRRVWLRYGNQLDAAIDAALAQAKEGERT